MEPERANGDSEKPQPRYQGGTRVGMQELFDAWYEEMAHAKERGRYVVYNWIGGNLRELFLAFDMINVYPEINSLQSGVKKLSLKYIIAAEEYGYSPDVCAYVKTDVGLILAGMKHPRGKIPPPDLIFNNSFCNTFIKWSEILQRFHTGAVMATVDIPGKPRQIDYKAGDEEYDNQKRYVLRQLQEVIAACERVTGRKFDPDKLAEVEARSNEMAELFTYVVETNVNHPAPFEAMLDGLNILGVMNSFRGTEEGTRYMEVVLKEMRERVELELGCGVQEKFRLVMDGTPCWPYLRKFADIFHLRGAVIVYAHYIGGTAGGWDAGFRFDTSRPLDSLADFALLWNTAQAGANSILDRLTPMRGWVRKYHADGVVLHSIKSCRAYSGGMADYREWFQEDGTPALMIESDIVDPRYFSEAQIRNRVEAFLESLEQKKFYSRAARPG